MEPDPGERADLGSNPGTSLHAGSQLPGLIVNFKLGQKDVLAIPDFGTRMNAGQLTAEGASCQTVQPDVHHHARLHVRQVDFRDREFNFHRRQRSDFVQRLTGL